MNARREGAAHDTPHYELHVADDQGTAYRIAVNVQSQQHPSELLYLIDDDFRHPVIGALRGRGTGWHRLDRRAGDPNLDYVRGKLFDRTAMRRLPPDVAGPGNDLSDLLDLHVTRAISDPAARVMAFGERWGPEAGESDEVFGFQPGTGVHNIHMNQGNSAHFRGDDGTWQDGALVIWFPGSDRWVAIFLAFQSQAWHTDDTTGHAIDIAGETPPTTSPTTDPALRVVEALVKPPGPALHRKSVVAGS
jgi:uncharacterized protein YukJ